MVKFSVWMIYAKRMLLCREIIAEMITKKYDQLTQENVMDILHEEIGLVFEQVLKDAGVYKCTDEGRAAFARFVNKVNES